MYMCMLEANESAMRIARLYTGRHKIFARYRSYHGASSGSVCVCVYVCVCVCVCDVFPRLTETHTRTHTPMTDESDR